MRSRLLFFVVAAMLVMLVYLVATRARDPHEMPRPRPPEVAEAAAPDAGAPSASTSASAAADAAPAPALGHPLRVVAASWDAVATLLVANGGLTTADGSDVRKAGLDVQVDVLAGQHEIEDRLARGGADASGADVALMWLPTAIGCDERLGALELQTFFVVGWSRGREVLLAGDDAVLSRPRTARETVVVSQDDSASTLAVFALGEATTPPNVRVVHDADAGAFMAFARPLPADRAPGSPSKTVMSTAEASRLLPLVAVAPRGFVEGHAETLSALVRAWLAGAESTRKDVPAVVRKIAAEPGAPDPATMIERLGWIATSDEVDETRVLLGSDPAAFGVQTLYRLEAGLLDGAGVLSIHPRERTVVAPEPVRKALASPPAPPPAAVAAPSADARVWLAHRMDRGEAHDVAREVALLTGVFERSGVRISTRPASLAKDVATSAHDDFGVPVERLVVAAGPPVDASKILLEVLAAP